MLTTLITNFAANPTENVMDDLIIRAQADEFTDDDIAMLAIVLAKSGDIVLFPKELEIADIPSTGGPSSLSTIICPLVLVNNGYYVSKLGIVGRPAGGIDVMHQIPGYRIDFTGEEVRRKVINERYCHYIVNDAHAPLDVKLFEYRNRKNAKAIPSLVISSILAKKLAAGVQHCGLDIRVGPLGNFGSSWGDARANAIRFVAVARKVGINAKGFLNNFQTIQQPFIGRSESLIAIKTLFDDRAGELLNAHLSCCLNMANSLGKPNLSTHLANNKIIRREFIGNLIDQGSSTEKFEEKVEQAAKGHIHYIEANDSGHLTIDMQRLRGTILWGQEHLAGRQRFPDNCGVVFKQEPNSEIEKGDVILSYRATDLNKENFKKLLIEAINIEPQFNSGLSKMFEIVK